VIVPESSASPQLPLIGVVVVVTPIVVVVVVVTPSVVVVIG
jgi:hypothetical protein